MADPTAEFFDRLGRRGHEPLLEEVSGTIRFDLDHDHVVDHWHVTITNGHIEVKRGDRDADTVVHADRTLFDRFVCGKANLYTAWARNEIRIKGNVMLARLLQRTLPGAPGAHHPRDYARERRRQA